MAGRKRDPELLRLLAFEYDECALCGLPGPLHMHHVLYRSQGGDDVRANIVALCQHCHHDIHMVETDVHRLLARHIEEYREDTRIYLTSKLGFGGAAHWFDVRLGR